jgi:hypothetical protein
MTNTQNNVLAKAMIEETTNFIKANFKHMDNFAVERVILSYAKSRTCHYGGTYVKKGCDVPGISLAMQYFQDPYIPTGPDFPLLCYEYKMFEGTSMSPFYYYDFEHDLQAVILHEVSHAAQYFAYKAGYKGNGGGHGEDFTRFYEPLREKLLNPYLPNQKEAKKQFNDYVKSIST